MLVISNRKRKLDKKGSLWDKAFSILLDNSHPTLTSMHRHLLGEQMASQMLHRRDGNSSVSLVLVKGQVIELRYGRSWQK